MELPRFPYNVVARTVIDAEGAAAFEDLVESGRVSELASATDRIGDPVRRPGFLGGPNPGGVGRGGG